MKRVYASGSLSLRADDRATKAAAVMLQALGFLGDRGDHGRRGTAPAPAWRGERSHGPAWRLSKPAFSGTAFGSSPEFFGGAVRRQISSERIP